MRSFRYFSIGDYRCDSQHIDCTHRFVCCSIFFLHIQINFGGTSVWEFIDYLSSQKMIYLSRLSAFTQKNSILRHVSSWLGCKENVIWSKNIIFMYFMYLCTWIWIVTVQKQCNVVWRLLPFISFISFI